MDKTRKLHPAGNDYIIKQLLEYGWRRAFIVFGIILLFAVLPVVLSLFSGTFNNNQLNIDAVSDYSYFAMYFILLPFFVIFIPIYLHGLEEAINTLRGSSIIRLSEEDYEIVIRYSNNLFGNKAVTLSPYLIAILLTIFTTINYNLAGHNNWDSSSLQDISFISLLAIFIKYLFYFFFFALLLRIVLTYFVINKFLNGNVDVQPLNPDNCGGLSPLGEFALRISWAGIGIGIPLVILIYANYYNKIPQYELYNTMNIISYVIAMTIVFFLPLLGARKSMLQAKNYELKKINDIFQKEREISLINLDKNRLPSEIEISNLENLIKLHNIAKSMPVWPFNLKNIVRFLSSVLWPVLLILIEHIVGKILI
jgi:hypothetical protein